MVTGSIDWQQRYTSAHTPWDLRGVTGALRALADDGFFADLGLPPGARVAVPGCGRGHDLRVFAGLGHRVHGFDISPAAVAEAKALLQWNRAVAAVSVRDVFGLSQEFPAAFDIVYDYTCYCTFPPHLRAAYVREVTGLLAPGGWLLMLAFPMRVEAAGREGPPYLITEHDLEQTVVAPLQRVDSMEARNSPPGRQGAERWYLWRRGG